MSNFLAIATVTATLRRILQGAVDSDVPGAKVTTVRPDGPSSGIPQTGVNIYLYQISPNAAMRNSDLPSRTSGGSLQNKPRIAVDLHYLLTFYGDESELKPQRLLGSVVRTLNARPVLFRKSIQDTLADPSFNYLAGSDLADAIDTVKFTPVTHSLEELSKLWSVLFQTPYALSAAFLASVVVIEGRESPRPALPVRERNLYTVLFNQPVIEKIMAQKDTTEPPSDQPVLPEYRLWIKGRNLLGQVTSVRVGEIEVMPLPESLTETEMTVQLPADLRAGIQGLQVIHETLMGTPPVPHKGFESNVAPFVLRPRILNTNIQNHTDLGNDLCSAEIEVMVAPKVGREQRLTALLNEFDPPEDRAARAYSFDVPARDPGAPENSEKVTIPVTAQKGSYLIRLQVDGAESILDVDTDHNSLTFNQYVSPKITL